MGTSTRPKDWKMVEEGGMGMTKDDHADSLREFTIMEKDDEKAIEGLPPIHLTYNDLKTFRINSTVNQKCFVEVQNWLNAAYKNIRPDTPEHELMHILQETSTGMNVPMHELICQMLKESVENEDYR